MSAPPKNPNGPIRIVTAAALFDGHDAAINLMRRLIQDAGCEVIHLGHNRSVSDIVDAAIQEDVHAVAITSYQGGHMEFFTYLRELLNERGAPHIRIFGGGGGVIVPEEAEALHAAGINRIYTHAWSRSRCRTIFVVVVATSCRQVVKEGRRHLCCVSPKPHHATPYQRPWY